MANMKYVAGVRALGYLPSVYKNEVGSGGQRVHLTPVDSTPSSELQNRTTHLFK